MNKNQFKNFCLITLSICLMVIFWGAFVRFSHSGDGCGTHWPLCYDQIIPQDGLQKTWIEWIHRASSMVLGVFIFLLTCFSFKYFPKKHSARFWSVMATVFTCFEAGVGAALVLLGLTGQNISLLRVFIMNIHLLNSLFLTACLVFCFRSSLDSKINFKRIFFLACGFILIASFGSITSLSNTAFPSTSLIEGWWMDWNPQSHWLIRLRILHPILAILIGGGILYYLAGVRKSSTIYLLIGLMVFGWITGGSTLIALSPLFMKMIHLIFVYLIWINLLMI